MVRANGTLFSFNLILYSPFSDPRPVNNSGYLALQSSLSTESILVIKLSDSIAGFPSKALLKVETMYTVCLELLALYCRSALNLPHTCSSWLPAPVRLVSVVCKKLISTVLNISLEIMLAFAPVSSLNSTAFPFSSTVTFQRLQLLGVVTTSKNWSLETSKVTARTCVGKVLHIDW